MTTGATAPAWYVLRGYRYQLLQSLDAWLGLQPGEVLWLEIDEDFSVASATETVDTQVKASAASRGPRRRSLQSRDVQDAIRRYWSRSEQGTNPRQRLAFLAKGGAARERGLSFPNGIAGIEYWRKSTLDGDTRPLRTALAAIFEKEPLGDWINSNPADDELRARLLNRVRWLVDALDEGPLSDLVRDKIAELYLQKGFLVMLADESLRSLLDRVFETASERDASKRRLTAIDLHRSLEIAAGPSGALQTAVRAATNIDGLLVTRLGPVRAHIARRTSTVDSLVNGFRGEPVLWLYGSNAVGKSTLARLLAERMGGSWLALDLRSVQDDAKGALAGWRDLTRAILATNPLRGILIDDLASSALDALRGRLSGLVASVAAQGTRVIVTSSFAPSAALLTDLQSSANSLAQAPYLTEEDVRELITMQNGPSNELVDGWTRVVFLTTNGGHPVLVAAKVASLRARGWPQSALIEDIGPVPSDAVRTTREEARRRLLDEIPSPDARDLLRRLGSIFDRADDGLIIRLARNAPAIRNPSDSLTILRGSWIEVMPDGALRLSPLIADIGRDVPEQEAAQHRRTAAEHWVRLGTLDERTLPLCFWNALWGNHTYILARLCQTIQTMPRETLRGTAALLSPLTLYRTDRPIIANQSTIAAMLRLLQVEIASAVEEKDVATSAAMRLMEEIEEIDMPKLKLLQKSIAIPKICFADNVDLEPAFQLGLALSLKSVIKELVALNDAEIGDAATLLRAGLPAGVELPGFIFSVIVNRIRTSERMLQMIRALDQLRSTDRDEFIEAAAVLLGTAPASFVHNGWAQEQLSGSDLGVTLERFDSINAIVNAWDRPEVIAEVICARSVILDEGLNDKPSAIGVVDRAIARVGALPALVRQKAKVLGHAGDDMAAARLLFSVEDVVGQGSPFDRALALRDGAVSAACAGLHADAVRLFRKAHASLLDEGHHVALAACVRIEIALTYWAMGDKAAALVELADVLDAVEVLDPAASRQNERAHQFARACVGLFWKRLDPYPSGPPFDISFGQPSALSGDEPLLGVDLTPLADNWRLLALCELQAGADAGVERRSVEKQTSGSLESVELFIAAARYGNAVARNDISGALELGLLAGFAYRARQNTRGASESRVNIAEQTKLHDEILRSLRQDGSMGEISKRVVGDILLSQWLHGNVDKGLATDIGDACTSIWGSTAEVADVLAAASGEKMTDVSEFPVAFAARLAIAGGLEGNPRARFDRDLLLTSHVSLSLARRVLEPLVVARIVDGWARVIENEGFALRAPLEHGPAIEAGIAAAKISGLKGVAQIMLAAAPAVRAVLPQAWQQTLRAIVGS